jgi:excisionase family DNA binding protein
MKFLTCQEIAHELRVSTMTVYRWVRCGDLGSVKVGKSLRIRADVYERFLDARSSGTVAP